MYLQFIHPSVDGQVLRFTIESNGNKITLKSREFATIVRKILNKSTYNFRNFLIFALQFQNQARGFSSSG